MRKDYEFIDNVQEGDEETHAQVNQMYMVASLDLHFSILYGVLKKHGVEGAEYKVGLCLLSTLALSSTSACSQLKEKQRACGSDSLDTAVSLVSAGRPCQQPRHL